MHHNFNIHVYMTVEYIQISQKQIIRNNGPIEFETEISCNVQINYLHACMIMNNQYTF